MKTTRQKRPDRVIEPKVFKKWREFIKDELNSIKVKVTPNKMGDKKNAKLCEEMLDEVFKEFCHKPFQYPYGTPSQLSSDQGGATTKVSREGATLKHTAKVRPKYITGRKVHQLQELLQTDTCGGMTQIKVLDDFWNWSEEVTEKINQILSYLHI